MQNKNISSQNLKEIIYQDAGLTDEDLLIIFEIARFTLADGGLAHYTGDMLGIKDVNVGAIRVKLANVFKRGATG